MNTTPTVFHITHIKAGSQWIAQILRECAPDREVPQKDGNAQTLYAPLRPGGIYPGVYLSKRRFDQLVLFKFGFNPPTYNHLRMRPMPLFVNWINFQLLKKTHIKFVVIRDLRDTLVSLYFSVKVSHEVMNPLIAEQRSSLKDMDKETGLLYLIEQEMHRVSINQESWMNTDNLLIKYEDLLVNDYELIAQIVDHCQISIPSVQLKDIVARNSFEAITGRQPGQEDKTAHFRKGIVGDWRNHFTPRVIGEVKKLFGQTLIRTGYEKDLNW